MTQESPDGRAVARQAGLRYVHDGKKGITRKRSRNGFVYYDSDGNRIRSREEIARIQHIGVPPAYTDVWICPYENGHLQATGRDARGRKQYRYHPRWREVRDESKYGHIVAFAEALPRLRERVDCDLASRGLPREKVLATIVRLLDLTAIRVGNEEYARANRSYGLTTLLTRHVGIEGASIHFHFKGKSGKTHSIDLKDRRLASIVRRCHDLPGQDLFEYVDENGECRSITSTDVNAYLREITGEPFTAKDFRTWAGTVQAALALVELGSCASQAEGKRCVTRAIEQAAERLGNTPAICRKCYVHPAVIEGYLDATLIPALAECSKNPYAGLNPNEGAVAPYLRSQITCR